MASPSVRTALMNRTVRSAQTTVPTSVTARDCVSQTSSSVMGRGTVWMALMRPTVVGVNNLLIGL